MPENGNSEVENNAETDYRTGIRTHIDRMRRGEHNEETMMALDRLNRLYEVENQERAIDETNAWFDELSPMGYNGLRDLNLVREFFEDGYFKGGMLVEMYKHWQGNNLWKDKYADNALTIKQGNETLGQGETEVDFDSIEPVGKGAFGNIYDQFKGKVKQAIDFLLHKKEGEALSALNHKEVGDIDLVWGKEGTGKSNGFGLAKIAKYHPEVLNNLQDILDDMVVVSRTENRIRLESKTHEAAISLEYYGENKKWLLTAYEKRESLNTKTMNTDISQNTQEGDSLLEDSHNSKSATTLVTPDSTNGSRAVASDLELENGTTTPQKSISNTNIQNNSDNSQKTDRGRQYAEKINNSNSEIGNNNANFVENNKENDKDSEQRNETQLDNGRAMESRAEREMVGRYKNFEAIRRTAKASNSGGSESSILTLEEREELETRGINPDWDKRKFKENLKEQAIQNDVWLENSHLTDNTLLHDHKGKNTTENDVYINPDNKTVTKVNNLSTVRDGAHENNLTAFFDRIDAHNVLFPNVPITVMGFGNNKHGDVSVIMEQPYIEAERNATQEEISEYLESSGFVLDGTRPWSYGEQVWSNGVYELFDAKPANVLKGKDSKLYFIDTIPHSVAYMKQDTSATLSGQNKELVTNDDLNKKIDEEVDRRMQEAGVLTTLNNSWTIENVSQQEVNNELDALLGDLFNRQEGGATLEEVQEFLNREGKNRRFVENLSYLNPKGFVYQTLQRFYGTQNADGLQDMEKFAGWIGEIRKTFKDKITDAHEKEVFDFLMNRDLSKRFTNKQDFIEKVRAIVETLDYDSNQPLNLSRVKDKTNLEREWDNTLNELTQDKKKVEKEIDTLRERFTNPAMEGFIDPNSASYTELKRRSDEKIGLLQNQVRSLEQKIVEHRQKKRDVIRAGMNQTSLFDFHSVQGKMQEITRKSLDKIVKRLLKSVPNANVHIVNQQQVERMIADSLRLEKEQIVAQAKANGTYMKAPNGKPTNLNEEQWVTVRTEAFKDWFGDWELGAKEVQIAEGKPHDFKNFAEAKAWAKENIARTYTNEETGGKGEIKISNTAIDKFFSKSAIEKSETKDAHLSTLKSLPEIIRNSIEAEQHADYLKGEDGIRRKENGINENVTIHRLFGAVNVGGETYRVKVTLKRDRTQKAGKNLYSYETTKIELLAGQNGDPVGTPRYSNNSITGANLLNGVEKSYEKGEKILDHSKVVDENGEPLVVYHGYRSEDFYEFEQREAYVSSFLYGNKKVKRNGFFFSPDFEFSKKYELRPYGSKERIMRTFLNIKNPFNFSQNLHLKGINENISQLFDKFLEEAETNGIQVFNNDFSLLVPSERAWEYLDDEIGVFFVEFLKKRGYDGVFLEERDVDKISMEQEKAIDFSTIVALHPNQIKSATANVGTFSEDSDDIRYHNVQEQKGINATFNEELAQMREGSLPSGHIFQLGRPNTLLQSAGIPNLPIELKANKLKEKSEQENHPFDLSEMESLPQAIQNPIAVFDSSTMVGRKVIFTELTHEGKNFVVALELNSRRTGIQVNSIRSVYPRNNTQIVRAITNNEAVYINKEKATDWLGRQQFNSADATQLANRSANIINNFENPKPNNNLQELRTNNGTVYGMARGNNIYLNADAGLNANTAIHEFGHLWVHSLRNGNKALYNKAIATVLRDKKAMELMRNNPNYIHLKSDEAIAEEILATEIGNLGERFTNPAMEGFIDPNSASYTELKRRSDEKIGLLQNQVRSLEQKIVEHRQKKRDVIRAGMNQTSLFDFHSVQGKMQEITRKSLDKIVKRLLKSVPNANVHIVNQQQVERMIADSLRLEKEQIVAQAKANGTYMKAPNGKPTNLNEEQWVTVRTEAFKDWFGDWEKQTRINKLRHSEPIINDYNGQYELNRESAKAWAKENLRGLYVNKDTKEKIEISRVGIDKVTSHGMGEVQHLKSLVSIPHLIENTIFIEERNNEKNNGKYDSYRYYVAGIKIDGEDYTAKVVIGKKGDSKYYDHELTQIEKGNLISNLNLLAKQVAENQKTFSEKSFTTAGDAPLQPYSLSEIKDTKLISILQNNSSKVVDENGEPLVVYHGYRSEDFYEFEQREAYVSSFLYGNKKVKRNGFFFSPDFEFSKKYELSPYGSKERIMYTFLNIKSPFNFSQNLHLNGINENISQLFEKFLEEAETNGIQVFNNDFSLLVPSESAWGYLDDEIGVFFVEFLKKRGYDGVFLEEKDVDKISMEQEKAIDFSTIVALHPNQIKSATANVGTFSEDSDDIRYHTDSELSEQKRVNATFNEELAQMREGSLPSGHIFQLGRPNTLLQSAGIPNLPIELKANKLKEKSEQENHPFDLSEMESLPQAIQNPIAVFDSSTMVGRKVIFTELVHEGKNFVVALELNYKKGSIEVNDVRSVYPRSNTQIVRAITNNEAVYINKEKATGWLGRQRFNSAEATQLANRSANIINNFENPKQNNNLQELRTNNGTVYGMARGNNIYLNADAGLNANTAIHEFGHLWVHSLRNGNKALYNKAIATVLRDKKAMELMRNNPNYIHLKSDEAIAEEILATEIGNLGERKYQAEQSKSVLHRLAKHIWQWVRNTLSKGTKLERWSDAKWQSASLLDVANNISDNLLQGKKVPMVRLSKAEIVQNANVLRGLNSVQLRTVLFANDLVMEARCP